MKSKTIHFARLFVFLFCVLLQQSNFAQKIKLGKDSCQIKRTYNDSAIATFISLHDNENTAIEAYSLLPDSMKFNLVELLQNENRLLQYKKNKTVLFDPNRIFTKSGIITTLKKYNSFKTNSYIAYLEKFADTLLQVLDTTKIGNYLIAIHNNTDQQFSIQYYKKHRDTEDIYINPKEDKDDFILVTEKEDFEFIKSAKLNVVLLAKKGFEDDGSLSVYCIHNKIPYINVEAENGHKLVQLKQYEIIYKLLYQKNNPLQNKGQNIPITEVSNQ